MIDTVDWIEVDESKYNSAKRLDDRSVVIEMSISPYDVPHQVRGYFDEDRKFFVIEFKYIDDELTKDVKLDSHVIGQVGKNSGRVYGLQIDVDALGADAVALRMNHQSGVDHVLKDAAAALESMKRQRHSGWRASRLNTNNYSVADRVLGDYWDDLREPLLATGA